MDTISFEHEIGEAKGGTRVYASVQDLRDNESCLENGGCGIVRVRIEVDEVIEEQDLYGDRSEDGEARERSEP